jgi:hypothetical protein
MMGGKPMEKSQISWLKNWISRLNHIWMAIDWVDK